MRTSLGGLSIACYVAAVVAVLRGKPKTLAAWLANHNLPSQKEPPNE